MLNKVINVTDGWANVQCPACKKTRRYQISPGIKRKSLRCLRSNCEMKGKSRFHTFNHRGDRRESACGRVELFISSNMEIVFIKNTSLRGISFQGRKLFRRIRIGDRIEIQLKNSSGRKITRKIIIRNRSLDNIGAEYTDIPKF